MSREKRRFLDERLLEKKKEGPLSLQAETPPQTFLDYSKRENVYCCLIGGNNKPVIV